MAEMNPADIPLHVMEHAKLVLLDTLGVIGSALSVGILHHREPDDLYEIANIAAS